MNVVAFPFNSASQGATGQIAPALSNHDQIQLHADAHNALSMALYYLRQPDCNLPGAARKAVQALAAMRRLDVSASLTHQQRQQQQEGAV